MDETIDTTPRDPDGIARHEAGHAVMAVLLGYPAPSVHLAVHDGAVLGGWAEHSNDAPLHWYGAAAAARFGEHSALIDLAGNVAAPSVDSEVDETVARVRAALCDPLATDALLTYWRAKAAAIMSQAPAPALVDRLARELLAKRDLSAREVRATLGKVPRLAGKTTMRALYQAVDHMPADLLQSLDGFNDQFNPWPRWQRLLGSFSDWLRYSWR